MFRNSLLSAFLLQIFSLLSVVYLPDASAQSLDSIGMALSGKPIDTTYTAEVSADGGLNYGTAFNTTQKVSVSVNINVDTAHVNKNAFIFIVASYANKWYMKSGNGQWLPWDLNVQNLIPHSGPAPLHALENVIVEKQLSGLPGDFTVYVAYKIDGDIYFNAKAFAFSVAKQGGANAAPIEHVVIIVKENHTFDNYFGAFPGVNGKALPHASDPHSDQDHNHAAWLKNGHGSTGVKEQYSVEDIPGYWALAQHYSLCDNYFSDVASQSEPNYLFLIAADSPIIDKSNKSLTYQPYPPFDMPSLPQTLETMGRTWRNYADSSLPYFNRFKALKGHRWIVPVAQFETDLAKGVLADVTWLFPPSGYSEHPGPGNPVNKGANWTMQKVLAIAKSQFWHNTAIIIVWDDWGGWYDHVNSPYQSGWSGDGPTGYKGSQFRYGPRLPCLIVSPYAKQEVNSHFYSHASVIKFCLRLFGLPAWNVPALAKDDPSGDLWEAFDFIAPPRLAVPPVTPK